MDILRIDSLGPAKGAKRVKKRVGRGHGSGHGKTSGRGQKGQTARSGGSIRHGFEGGQTPLYMRFPKRGFKNPRAKEFGIINIRHLERYFEDGQVVTPDTLREKGLLRKYKFVKILGDGELTKKLIVKAHAFSDSAKEKIEKAGGQIEILPIPKYQGKVGKRALNKQK